jgi:addiction module HigA family antidote
MAKQVLPGTVLKDLLSEYNIPVAKIAEDIGLSPSAIRQLINSKLKISIVIAKKLSIYFGKPVQYWIDLQNKYELTELDKDTKLKASLAKIPKAKKIAPKAKAEAKPAKVGAKRGA